MVNVSIPDSAFVERSLAELKLKNSFKIIFVDKTSVVFGDNTKFLFEGFEYDPEIFIRNVKLHSCCTNLTFF